MLNPLEVQKEGRYALAEESYSRKQMQPKFVAGSTIQ